MFKLLRYMKKYWYFAVLAPIFMMIEVVMDMELTAYMEKMVDDGVTTGNMDNVLRYGLFMIGIVLIGVVAGVLSGVFANLASFKFGNDLRKDVFNKIMNLSVDQSDDFKTGSLVTRVTNDITQIQNMVSMSIRMFIRSLSFFIFGIIYTLGISSKFGFIIAIILPIELILMFVFMRVLFPVFGVIQQKLDKVNNVVLENVGGARVVKSFSKEPFEFKRFKNANDEYTAKTLFVGKAAALIMPILNIIVFGGQVVIYYIGGTAIVDAFRNATEPTIMVGQITQAVTYITMICSSIIMIGMIFTGMARAFASAKRVNEVLDCDLEILDGNFNKEDIKEEERGIVEFKNVSFKYPLSSQNVLNDITVKINKGECVAVVGSTGCGKSSLVNLLVRFYDATEGEVLVNGVNVKEYKKEDLRNMVAICLQKAELFEGTIASNISFGSPDATIDEIKKAAEIAQAMEFIEQKEDGINAKVTERGSSLSGGQKQRLSIARAVLRKPDVLIFDDSTSALDLVTESKLYKALNESVPGITKIVVAQRIATAKNADRIIVLDQGGIESFGTHDELMEKSPVYKDIYTSQLKREEV